MVFETNMSFIYIYSKLMAMYLEEIKLISVLNDFLWGDLNDAIMNDTLSLSSSRVKF